MYRYEIKKGAENRTFAGGRRVSENMLESDEPLQSSYLTLVTDGMGANPPQETSVASPESPTNPPQNEPANKEAN